MSYLRSYNTKNQPLDPNLISWFIYLFYCQISYYKYLCLVLPHLRLQLLLQMKLQSRLWLFFPCLLEMRLGLGLLPFLLEVPWLQRLQLLQWWLFLALLLYLVIQGGLQELDLGNRPFPLMSSL